MKVLVGPTYNMEVSASASASASSPVCVGDQSSTIGGVTASAAHDNNKAVSSSCLLLNGVKVNDVVGDQNTFGSDDSSDSSSIGSPGDSENEDEDQKDVVSSSETGVGLQRNKFSMSSLEDSLTSNGNKNRRGLSNHYSGKSKSFGNLTEVMSRTTAIKDLEKEENPFNKRRRVLIANKWSKKLFYSRYNPKSMPLLPILPDNEEEEEEEEKPAETNNHDDEEEDQEQGQQHLHGNKLKVKMGFKSQSCFCLADLAEEEEEEEEEDE